MSEDPINPDTPDGAGTSDPNANGVPASDRADSLAGLWARVVELEREARYLSAKCDYLRHSCRGLLPSVGTPKPFTDEDVQAILTESPRMSQTEALDEAIRLRMERAAGIPSPPEGMTPKGLTLRVAELEPLVSRLATRRKELGTLYLALAQAFEPFTPPTQEEIDEMLSAASGPPGPSIGDIVAEVERKLKG